MAVEECRAHNRMHPFIIKAYRYCTRHTLICFFFWLEIGLNFINWLQFGIENWRRLAAAQYLENLWFGLIDSFAFCKFYHYFFSNSIYSISLDKSKLEGRLFLGKVNSNLFVSFEWKRWKIISDGVSFGKSLGEIMQFEWNCVLWSQLGWNVKIIVKGAV